MKRISHCLILSLLFFLPFSLSARDVDPAFGDTIDRTADDFVIASVCIADPTDWSDDILGVAGHAFIRLQCPSFNLDYCFSYEGERINDNLNKYLNGKTKMGMFAVPTDEYLQDYRDWNRTVSEYRLNLPADSKQRLWEIMDNHLTGGIVLRQDLNKYGCAITVVRYVKKALAGTPIVYAPDEQLANLTRREIGYRSMRNHPWIRLAYMLFTDNSYDRNCPLDEKLIVPADLPQVWQRATVEGRQLAAYSGDIVQGATLADNKPWFTPMLVAILMLVITIALSFTRFSKYWEYFLLAIQTLGGLYLIYLWLVMSEYGSSMYLLMILINPLPAILWKWRKYYSLVYAALLLIGTITLACLPHMLVDPAMLVLALSYVVMYCKTGGISKLLPKKKIGQ